VGGPRAGDTGGGSSGSPKCVRIWLHAGEAFLAFSRLHGYVAAHDAASILPATPEAVARLVDAGGGLVRLVTLAPECDAAAATTRWLVDQGITVSAGHTDCSLVQLAAAIETGFSMVTHLGNGCPTVLPRHDNVIQRLLSRADDLWICFIPDGVHVPWFALKNYL
jgi:N-acetylglucosamine-6-phosphate deacetylase